MAKDKKEKTIEEIGEEKAGLSIKAQEGDSKAPIPPEKVGWSYDTWREGLKCEYEDAFVDLQQEAHENVQAGYHAVQTAGSYAAMAFAALQGPANVLNSAIDDANKKALVDTKCETPIKCKAGEVYDQVGKHCCPEGNPDADPPIERYVWDPIGNSCIPIHKHSWFDCGNPAKDPVTGMPVDPSACRSEMWDAIVPFLPDPPPGSEPSISAIYKLIEELTETKSLYACTSPYFHKFMNLIPYQFYIQRLLAEALEAFVDLLPKDKVLALKDTPCGVEMIEKSITRKLQIPEIPAIPPLPYIPIIRPLQVIENIIIEIMCYMICCTLRPLLRFSAEQMVLMSRGFVEWQDEDDEGTPKALPPELKKIDINSYVSDEAIETAITQQLIGKFGIGEVEIPNVRNYFEEIMSNQDIRQKHIIYLFLGEADCNVIGELITIGKNYPDLDLIEQRRILEFFKFLGSFVNVFQVIKESKEDICVPDYCEKIQKVSTETITNTVKNLCDLLNPVQGIPEIPVSLVMKLSGLEGMTESAIATLVEILYRRIKTSALTPNSFGEVYLDYTGAGKLSKAIAEHLKPELQPVEQQLAAKIFEAAYNVFFMYNLPGVMYANPSFKIGTWESTRNVVEFTAGPKRKSKNTPFKRYELSKNFVDISTLATNGVAGDIKYDPPSSFNVDASDGRGTAKEGPQKTFNAWFWNNYELTYFDINESFEKNLEVPEVDKSTGKYKKEAGKVKMKKKSIADGAESLIFFKQAKKKFGLNEKYFENLGDAIDEQTRIRVDLEKIRTAYKAKIQAQRMMRSPKDMDISDFLTAVF
tara:strand:- start:140 stop:2575 length:2436 start_codon:yes stop_codon:yes gene_type:complete